MAARRLQNTTLAAILLVASTAAAHGATTSQQLLARPLSPGSVAALISHVTDVSAQAKLVQALADPRAEVRAMAAHVTFVARAKLAMSSVPKALEAETDDRAAAEMIRVVATFDADPRLEWLVDVARARGPSTRAALLESLARSRPELLARVTGDRVFDDAGLAGALVLASAQHPAERAALAKAAVTRGPELWASYLRQMHEQLVAVNAEVLKETLSASDEAIRTATAFHVAMLAGHVHGVDRGVLAVAADGAETGTATTWERAYREVARRVMKRPARPVDWASLLGPDTPDARRDRVAGINATFLGADRETVQSLVGGTLPGAEWFVKAGAWEHLADRVQKTRTLASPIARVLPDLLAVLGCRSPAKGVFAAATMGYGPDGRARVVRPADNGLDEACARAAHVAFLLTVAPPTLPVQTVAGRGLQASANPASDVPVLPTSDGIYLPFFPAYLGCAAVPAEPVHDAVPGPDRTMPKPKGRIEPDYPRSLKALQVTGSVQVEAEVTSRGCVRTVETVRSLHPMLDAETLRAVLEAPFEPMMLHGHPVASRVVLSVTFRP